MSNIRFLFYVAGGFIICIGLFLRLYHISHNQFLFYDEGMYLGYNRDFLNLVANNPPHDLKDLMVILSLMLKASLSTAKALWFFILNLRVFFLGTQAWYFARWISAASGLATVVLLFFWARRYLGSTAIAAVSALLLMVLPSHVFYCRLGMQEALSTFLFLSGTYLYMSRGAITWHFFASALLLALVYFTNYRMIIAPVFVVFLEAFSAWTLSKKFPWTKVVAFGVVFYAIVFGGGSLYGGVNNYVNLAWMFHQAKDAGGQFNIINFVSYPYYTFALEGIFFGLVFWLNLYFLKTREYSKLLPFGMVLVQMAGFSFASEKGARYLCVVLPFMAAAAGVVLVNFWQRFVPARIWILTLAAFTVVSMLYLSGNLAMARTDYENAVNSILDHDPQAVIVSTQPLVESLYMPNDKRTVACPNDLLGLVGLYKQGARYLVLDPQAYISWDQDGKRFSPPLVSFLQLILKQAVPVEVLPHLNQILLTRFVLDHNEQILDSIKFLSVAQSEGYGKIRVYDLASVFAQAKQ